MKKILLFLFLPVFVFAQSNTKFYVHNDLVPEISNIILPDEGTYPLATNPQFQFDTSATITGYTELTNFSDWNRHWGLSGKNYKEYRNILIDKSNTSWATYSKANKQSLIENYVWISTATTTELDTLHISADRDEFQKQTMEMLSSSCNVSVRVSITDGSKNYFDIQVDDLEILYTTKITTGIKLQ